MPPNQSQLLKFLINARIKLQNVPYVKRVHVVLGNESCDYDSAVSALTYAYYIRQKTPDYDVCIVPMLNMESCDFPLKTETKCALNRFQVTQEKLIFRDTFDLEKVKDRLSITLVDHNKLTKPFTEFGENVTEIIDHHVRDGADDYKNAQTQIAMVGSCCTLVAMRLLSDNKFKMPDEIALLLYECILCDTVCLSPSAGKKTSDDEAVVSVIERRYPALNRETSFQFIEEAKLDTTGLNTIHMLRKDLKFVREGSKSIAMSSIPGTMDTFSATPEFESDLKFFVQSQKALALIIMMYTITPERKLLRQLAVFCLDDALRDKICCMLKAANSRALKLIRIDTHVKQLNLYDQHATSFSRKQVLPLVSTFLKTL